jgi:hypothetical protein
MGDGSAVDRRGVSQHSGATFPEGRNTGGGGAHTIPNPAIVLPFILRVI